MPPSDHTICTSGNFAKTGLIEMSTAQTHEATAIVAIGTAKDESAEPM